MPNNVKHFSINADDVPRARRFYEKAFGWKFEPWGPPNFYLIKTGTDKEPGLEGALQGRREIVAGETVFGFLGEVGGRLIDEDLWGGGGEGGKKRMVKVSLPSIGEGVFFL